MIVALAGAMLIAAGVIIRRATKAAPVRTKKTGAPKRARRR
jgi:hypothetical protein